MGNLEIICNAFLFKFNIEFWNMKKTIRVIQIIFSVIGIICVLWSAGLALMVSVSALSSAYTAEVVGSVLFLSCFLIALTIFILSIFKPKALAGLFLLPILMGASIRLENSAYNITPKFKDLLNHKKIGSELVVIKRAYLISKLPKKRMRNYSYLCKHDFEISESQDFISPAPSDYWKNELRMEYVAPKFEEVVPPIKLKVVGAFQCDRIVYLSLKDSSGRLIEASEIEAELLATKEK